MRAVRHGFERADLAALVLGGVDRCSPAGDRHSGRSSARHPRVGLRRASASSSQAGWLLPHVIVAVTIPFFALLPTAKVFISARSGP